LGVALFLLPVHSWAQNAAGTTQAFGSKTQSSDIKGRFRYYVNATHAGQRATLQFGFAAAGNLLREFAPQMPRPLRTVFQLIAR
jgi:hypothetical protein